MEAGVAAIIAGVPTAIVAALGSYFAARRQAYAKIEELKVGYDQERKDLYLETVRAHIDDIYLPINSKVSQLATAFKSMKNASNFKKKAIDPTTKTTFEAKFREYDLLLDEIRNKGLDAFIPDHLDYQLVAFANFMRESMGANKNKVSVVAEVGALALTNVLAGPTPLGLPTLSSTAVRSLLRNLTGEPGVVAERTASPLWDQAFEQEFLRRIRAIKRYIREATLLVGGRRDTES